MLYAAYSCDSVYNNSNKIRVVRILHKNNENSADHFHEFCALFQANFSTLQLSVASLYYTVLQISSIIPYGDLS